MYNLLQIKRFVENIFIFPFILTGRLVAIIRPLKKEYRVFYFFPFYHTGGAELFNMRLTHAVGGNDCIIYFTKRSRDDRFYKEFKESGCIIKDISKFTDNKWFYFLNLIFRGIISGYINSQKRKPIVFNGQCNFGYKISPWISKRISQLEFIHTFCSFSYIRVPFLPYYRLTISSSIKTINDHKIFYQKWGVPGSYSDKFKYILYGIELPVKDEKRIDTRPFTVLFVGRGSPEKRVQIAGRIAKAVNERDPDIQFVFMGDIEASMPKELHQYCIFLGNQTDKDKIHEVYCNADTLLITSAFEGFPLVVMEAMARGLAIISTSVGDVPKHVRSGINGFIIEEIKEEEIIDKGSSYIFQLMGDKELLRKISNSNIEYAFKKFGLATFNANYKQLFKELEP